jgi:type IV secretory pathway TrbD component
MAREGEAQEGTKAEAAPRTVPVHGSLVRPILLAGADRELTLVNAIVCFALLFGIGASRWTVGIVLVIATVGQWALGRVTRYDPDFRRVYARHVQLQAYYPGAPSLHAGRAVVHPALPFSE